MRRVKEIIALTAAYYGQAISNEVLLMYADDLSDLPEHEVVAAYQAYRRNPKNTRMPLPAQIRSLVEPEMDADALAKEIAARISGAIVKFGYPNGQEAKEYIGEVGWQAVQRQGGWSYICQNHGVSINPGTFQAQVREQVKTHLTHGSAAIEQAIRIGASPQPGLQNMGSIMSLIDGGKK
jgi:hypothetical protein